MYKEDNGFHHITIATKPHQIVELMKTRINLQGEKIAVLAEKEDRYIGWQANANFGLKLKEVYYYIWNSAVNFNDIVLFTDAYDVIYCGNHAEIIRRFKEFNKPIVFGAEKICSPDPERASEYCYKNMEFPYLNSGLYIGYIWALQECMVGYNYNDVDDDQRFWTNVFFKRQDLMTLDYYNSIFLNTAGVNVKEIEWDGRKATYNKRSPMFVHVNGPDKTELNYFLS